MTRWMGAIVAVIGALAGTAAVAGPAASAATVSVNCDQHPLQPKLDNADPGTVLLVKGTCDGAFVVHKDVTLKGNPTATLDANGAGRPLTVVGTHALHLRSLVVTGGSESRAGAISLDEGGVLTLDGVTVRDNQALGATAVGGGIFASGAVVTIRHSVLRGNQSVSSGSGLAVAQGGAIEIQDGSLTISDSVVRGNRATAVSSASLAEADAGAVFVFESTAVISSTVFQGNRVSADAMENASAQAGAVLFQRNEGDVTITDSTFDSNAATATSDGTHEVDALAGALKISVSSGPGPVHVARTVFRDNTVTATATANKAVGQGGAVMVETPSAHPARLDAIQVLDSTISATGATAATGRGGGIQLGGPATMTRSIVSGNDVSAHSGNNAALGQGGGISASVAGTLSLATTTVAGNTANALSDASGAAAGGGGIGTANSANITLRMSAVSGNTASATATGASAEALGGGLSLLAPGASDLVVNSTITGNHATVSGPNADSAGAGIEVGDELLGLRFSTVARNAATASGSGVFAGGGGLDIEHGTTTLEATIVAANTGVTGPDCLGTFTSNGFNLIGSTVNCTFGAAGTDQSNVPAKLGSFDDHGGPTMTIALLAGSPALNKVPTSPCHALVKKDQRLVTRPQGPACDEGAFEKQP